ncbi:hypothetical protein DCAR_0313576 [Daucus carota subsp. sativus]|uniref:IST1-like protein n=2 Tax=Daucus carota subsp. sativus TaxID=79200 RepID=A0AAF0WTH4_DAUCS|nr:PREDICTED: uncharacterized protein LOC108212999 [Daucus carota subsp. sativus]WOG94283.1 hypothetical protein DCAR_0313576 [Daucus carota subsp. sativus]
MLTKSFKASKCKTSLKLATSRIKLMKNKKGVQMVQMKRELAQLLESGQDRTARIRVEHLIREEKMVAAYELIEIYCELIAARLPIIESQKNCPIDLKEAIASVVFASPRCSDIPELTDVKKHFTAKYGKEFITAALELRPNSGVGRMVVEKLSAVAPDVQTKAKVLNAIAEEHNIKWDSKSFEEKESKPAEDLLNGPSTFEKAGEMQAVPKIQVPHIQATSGYDKPVRLSNSNESGSRSSFNTPNYSTADSGVLNTRTGINPDLRSSGSWAERMENRQSFKRDDAYLDRKHWDIEFKDATSAAHAAAEAAERASMAARAAAELSTRENITRRYSTESQKLNRHDSRQGYYAAGNGEDFNRDVQEEDRRHSQSSAQSYSKASINDDKYVNSMQKPDKFSENVSFKETTRAEMDIVSPKNHLNRQSFEGGTKRASGWQDNFDTENVDEFGVASMGEQHNSSSSFSHSSTDNEIYTALDHKNSKSMADEDPYVGNYQESVHNDVKKMDSYNDYFADYDEDESNDEKLKFDAGPKYDEGESTSYAPSPERTSAPFSRTSVDTWNPRRDAFNSPEPLTSPSPVSAENLFSPRFSEIAAKSINPTESDKVPGTYDVDTPKFDSEDELDDSTYEETNDSRIYSPKHKGFSQYPERAKVESQGSLGSAFKEIHIHKDDVHATGSADTPKDDRLAIQNGMEGENELSFGALKGGFRNKSYVHPPYRKLSGDASSSTKEVAEQNLIRKSSRSKLINNAEAKSSFSRPTTSSDPDADADDSVDEVIQKATSVRKAPESHKVRMKSKFMPPVGSYFDDDEESTEDVPEKTFPGRDHLVGGASRRTRDSNGNYIPESVGSVNLHSQNERKSNSSNYGASTSTELKYQARMTSSHTGSGKEPGTAKQATSKPMQVSKTSTPETKFKPSAGGQPSNPYRDTETKDNLGNVKTPPVEVEPPKKEDPPKRASHVHPKLPDYQSLAAHMQSLRSNRH